MLLELVNEIEDLRSRHGDDPALDRIEARIRRVAGRRADAVAERAKAIACRDDLLRQAAAMLKGSDHERAHRLEHLLADYRRTFWQVDSKKFRLLPRLRGTLREVMWKIFNAHPGKPLKWRRIFDIISK